MNTPRRCRWLGAAALGCVAGLMATVLVAAAGPAAPPARTRIHLELPVSPEPAAIFRVVARLADETGSPIDGAEVTFYQSTEFGSLPIKTAITDEKGRASLQLRERYADRLTVGVRFAGDALHDSAYVEAEIVFRGAQEKHPVPTGRHSPSPALPVKLVVFLIVGGVWLTYGYAVLLTVQAVRTPR